LEDESLSGAIAEDEIDFSFDSADFDIEEEHAAVESREHGEVEIGSVDEFSMLFDEDDARLTDAAVSAAPQVDVNYVDATAIDAVPVDASGLSFEDELGAMLGDASPPADLSVSGSEAEEVLPRQYVATTETVQSSYELSRDEAYTSSTAFDELSIEYASDTMEQEISIHQDDFGVDYSNETISGEIQNAEIEVATVHDELEAAIAELESDSDWNDPVDAGSGLESASHPIAQQAPDVVETLDVPVEPAFLPVSDIADKPRSRFSFIADQKHVEPEPQPDGLADDPFAALAAMAAAPPILRALGRGNPVAVDRGPANRATPSQVSHTPAAPVHVAAASAISSTRGWERPVSEPARPASAPSDLDLDDVALDFGTVKDHNNHLTVEADDWKLRSSSVAPAYPDSVFQASATAGRETGGFDELETDAANDGNFEGLLADDFAAALETVEFQDEVVAVADDLDLPELPADENIPSNRFDDFDTDFADAFRQLGDPNRQVGAPVANSTFAATHETANAKPVNVADENDHLDADFASFERELAAQGGSFDRVDDFDFEPQLEEQEPRRASRMPLYGAIFGGLVLLAGIGAYASGMFGTSDVGEPALVRADVAPVKVKPETPGGVVVPNQDGQVYERVAGDDPKAPLQEKLVSNAEEPIVPQPRPVSDALPGVEDTQIKSEDRVIPEEISNPQPANEVVALAPRKVRTMVVRPDGTLAPRPEPVAEAAAPAAAAAVEPVAVPQAIEPAEAVAKPEPADAAPARQEPAVTEDVPAPKAVKTTTVKPKPAPEPEPQKVAAAPQPAQVDMAGGAASTVAATPTGQLWTVQIASQPTREGAQSSYESLARKYGSVIGGKGVNIVQADIEGKGTMWRVRIPAASKSDANILCAKLKTAGGSCFVSR
jgi:hypothetical protein